MVHRSEVGYIRDDTRTKEFWDMFKLVRGCVLNFSLPGPSVDVSFRSGRFISGLPPRLLPDLAAFLPADTTRRTSWQSAT